MELRDRKASEPIINAPTSLLVLIAVTVAAFLLMEVLPTAMQEEVILYFALFPARYAATPDGVNWVFPGGWLADLWTPFTYVLLHGSWSHLLVNLIWLLAFGKPVAQRLGTRRFLVFYFVCGLAGAIAHVFFYWGALTPVVGASAAVAGLMAGAARFVFIGGPGGFAVDHHVSRGDASIRAALRNRNVLIFVGVWMGLNILFGPTGISPTGEAANIAWVAHIGGFLAGLLLFGLFDPMQRSASGGPGNVGYGEWRGRRNY